MFQSKYQSEFCSMEVGSFTYRFDGGTDTKVQYPCDPVANYSFQPNQSPGTLAHLKDKFGFWKMLIPNHVLSYHKDHTQHQAKPKVNSQTEIILFSHGLHGSQEIQNSVCASLAHLGQVVICLNQEDGTGTNVYGSDGKLIDYKSQKGKEVREEVSEFREQFLNQREAQLRHIFEILVNKQDTIKDNVLLNVLLNNISKKVNLVGHSFGSSTVLQFMKKLILDEHPNSHLIDKICLLDPWVFCLKEEVTRFKQDKDMLVIDSATWVKVLEQEKFKNEFIPNNPKTTVYLLKDSAHMWVSDVALGATNFVLKMAGMMGKDTDRYKLFNATIRKISEQFNFNGERVGDSIRYDSLLEKVENDCINCEENNEIDQLKRKGN